MDQSGSWWHRDIEMLEHCNVFKTGNQGSGFLDCPAYQFGAERGFLASLVHPNFANPDDVRVGAVAGRDLSNAARHILGSGNNQCEKRGTAAWGCGDLIDETDQVFLLSGRRMELAA